MDTETFDVIIVGGGIIGTYTAYRLILENRKVLLIDQVFINYGLYNTRRFSCSNGSSSGRSRGVQRSTLLDPSDCLEKMIIFSLMQWNDLDEKYPQKFMRPTNLLYVGRKDESFVKQANQEDPDDEKRNRGDNFKLFSRSDIREHYPDLNIPEDYVGLLDADSKTLFADDIIKHLMDEFLRSGGKRVTTKVENIISCGNVTVHTAMGVLHSKKVLLATGPWSNDFLTALGLSVQIKTKHIRQVYYKLKSPDIPTQFPTVVEYRNGKVNWSNITTEYGPCLKILLSGDYDVNPTDINMIRNIELTESIDSYAKQRFKNLEDTPVSIENCIYSLTPDLKPLIGIHPQYKNIVVGVGMCGYGFGNSPAISIVLCDLLCDRSPRFKIDEFALNRFL